MMRAAMTRTSLASITVLLGLLGGCKDSNQNKSDPGGAGEAAGAAREMPPVQPQTETPAAGENKSAGAAADPAKVEGAANTALKIMTVVSSAVRGAKGDCARMGKNLAGVMTVAQKWRDQLAEQYKEPGVQEGVKSALLVGKYPELLMNLKQTRDGARACPDVAPELENVRTEIHGKMD